MPTTVRREPTKVNRPGLVLNNDLDRAHEAYARRTKHRGWGELQPWLFLAPDFVRAAMVEAGSGVCAVET